MKRVLDRLHDALFGRPDRGPMPASLPSIRDLAEDAGHLLVGDLVDVVPTAAQRADIIASTTAAGVAEARRRWHERRGEAALAERQRVIRDSELDTLENFKFATVIRLQLRAAERASQAVDFWERAVVRAGVALVNAAMPG